MLNYRSARPLVRAALMLSVATTPLIAVAVKPAHAQDATVQAVDLGVIVLEGQVGTGGGFKAEQSSAGTRIVSPLDELPLSVDVITPDLLEATNANRLDDAITATTGAAIGNQFGGLSDRFILRGFEADIAENGNLSGFQDVQQRDSVDVERIEVLSGPASALFGFGPPGGVINVTTKTPQDDQFLRFNTEVNTTSSVRQEFDYNTPLTDDGRVKARIVGAIEGINSFRYKDFTDDTFPEERIVLSPSILFEPNAKLSFLARGQYLRDESVFDRGIAIGLDGDPVSDIDDFLGDPEFDDFVTENLTGSVEAKYHINDDWSIKGTISGSENTRDGTTVEPEGFFENAGTFSPLLAFVAPEANSILRQLEFRDQKTTRSAARVDVNGAFTTGEIEHELSFSVERFSAESDVIVNRTGFLPPDGEVITLDDLGGATTLSEDGITTFSDTLTEVDATSVSIFDKLSYGDSVHVLIGGRLDHFDEDVDTNGEEIDLSETEFSPRVGVVVKPLADKNFSTFVSYGESFEPNLVPAADGGVLEPRDGRTIEGGVSYSFNDDRLLASLTAFDIEEDNVPLSFDGTTFVPTTNSSSGIELSLTGSLNDNWDINARYNYVDSEIGGVNGTLFGPAAGEPVAGVPDHTLALLASYRFDDGSQLEGLTLTGAVQYQSSRLLHNSTTPLGIDLPSIELDSFIRVDVSGSYVVNDRVTIQAGVQNLFDEEIIRPSAGFGLGSPEAGTNAFASVSFEF